MSEGRASTTIPPNAVYYALDSRGTSSSPWGPAIQQDTCTSCSDCGQGLQGGLYNITLRTSPRFSTPPGKPGACLCNKCKSQLDKSNSVRGWLTSVCPLPRQKPCHPFRPKTCGPQWMHCRQRRKNELYGHDTRLLKVKAPQFERGPAVTRRLGLVGGLGQFLCAGGKVLD